MSMNYLGLQGIRGYLPQRSLEEIYRLQSQQMQNALATLITTTTTTTTTSNEKINAVPQKTPKSKKLLLIEDL